MGRTRTLGIAAFAVLGLFLTAVPVVAKPISGIDAPLAGQAGKEGHKSRSTSNFGKGKKSSKTKTYTIEK